MSECQECDDGQIRKFETPYGIKEVCDTCGYVAKDVDTYAGVMVWSHKTAPEIEIHASKSSASAVLDSDRTHVVTNPVRVAHHAPQEMGGRRQNTGRVKGDQRLRSLKAPKNKPTPSLSRKHKVPVVLRSHVRPVETGDTCGMKTFTKFTSKDVEMCIAALPHTSSIKDLTTAMGLRAGKTKKAVGIISWLSEFGHSKPPAETTVWEDGDSLVLRSDRKCAQTSTSSYTSIDRETQLALGYRNGFTRY